MAKWISIKDKLPPLFEAVIVFCPDWCQEGFDIASIDNDKEWTNQAEQPMDEFVTHWQKLPKAPIE